MATQRHGIVPGDESSIHDEPHVEGRRVTVRVVQARVEERGDDPECVADQLDLDIASVYEALAYYHNNPEEMRAVERRHEEAVAAAKRRSDLSPPDGE
ncbi:DUF433 domain-containing protein [Halosimplex halobium]|uniref:DUF433 domain-containing protein n=1 Tax=Halosimplex halobium TaxID=3396618 RepID=UPI003F558E25